jgi:GTP:adenosylcobinamide-phosphate guanylyltransferase
MTRIIGVQARTGSTRLPGKVLMDLAGKTMLEHVVDSLRYAGHVYVLSPALDDDIAALCARRMYDWIGVPGDENDVLHRYMALCAYHPGAHVMRVCADAPFIQGAWAMAAFQLAEASGQPVWIEDLLHVGQTHHWHRAEAAIKAKECHLNGKPSEDREHAASGWFSGHCTVRGFVPRGYLMVNTREEYERARRQLSEREVEFERSSAPDRTD